ncbi:MAG: MaoC family dehydratase [Acidimicrobiales bacterium]
MHAHGSNRPRRHRTPCAAPPAPTSATATGSRSTRPASTCLADATGDHQWIHVDPERAADGPFGTTIAHGYLTVSLTNLFLPQIVEVRGVSMGVNYGVNKIRFPAPVPVGSRLRAGAELTAVDEVHGGVQTTMTITVEIEGGDRPACIVESISRWLD